MKTLAESLTQFIARNFPHVHPDNVPYFCAHAFYAGAAAMAEQFAAGQSSAATLLAEIRDEMRKANELRSELCDTAAGFNRI